MARTGLPLQTLRDEWDLPTLYAMNDYWREFPPINELLPNFLGYEPPPPEWDGDDSVFEKIKADVLDSIPEHLARLIH